MNKKINLSMDEIAPVIEECIADGREVVLTATGTSMRPYLQDRRDQVVLTAPDFNSLSKFDVVLYRRDNGQYVLHRIIALENGLYTLLGDAQTNKEYGIRSDQVKAVAKAFIRRGRRHDKESPSYRLYVAVWHFLLPVRRYFIALDNFFRFRMAS